MLLHCQVCALARWMQIRGTLQLKANCPMKNENYVDDGEALKILVIGSTYPLHEKDHQVPWMRETVRRIVERGHQVEVLASSFKGQKPTPIDGVPVHRFRYAPAGIEDMTHGEGAPNKANSWVHSLLGILYILSGTLYALRLAMKNRYDVVHVHWPFPHGIMGWLAARMTGARYLANCHGAELAMGRRKTWIRRFLRFFLRRADVVVCNSTHTQDEIRKMTDCDATIVPYGATVDVGTPRFCHIIPNGRVTKLLFCGRLIERKGIGFLLRALPLVLANRAVHLDITGRGDKMEEWQKLTTQLGLDEHVTFHGFVSNEELSRLYRECDVYVHPAIFDSRGDTEGLGVVLIEALMNAKPVVASKVGGIVDVIKHLKTGVLVEEKNPEEIADAIEMLIASPRIARKLGENGRKFAEWHFDWDRVIGKLERIYSETTSFPKPPQGGKRKVLAQLSKAAIVAIAGLGVFWGMRSVLPELLESVSGQVSNLDRVGVVSAVGLCLVYRVLNSHGWGLSMRALNYSNPMWKSSRVWLICETLRWLPGTVWGYCSRVTQAKRLGLNKSQAAVSVSVELILTIGAWATAAAIGLIAWGSDISVFSYVHPTTLVLALIGCLGTSIAIYRWAMCHPNTKIGKKVYKLVDGIRDALADRPSYRMLSGVYVYYTVLCILNGVAFWYVAQSLTATEIPMLAIIGVNAAGWLVGFLSIGAPGGIGAREGAMVAFLLPLLPIEVCIAATALWRALQIGVEVFTLGLYSLPWGRLVNAASLSPKPQASQV